MCRHHQVSRETISVAPTGAYEGETVRLDAADARPATNHQHTFPWWTLWLVWPLLSLIKPAVMVLIGLVSTVTMSALTLLPVLLILIGIILWWRGGRSTVEPDPAQIETMPRRYL
jgi:hypothetical protein